MQANYTLKQAVKTALAILAISAQTNVFALGLGNIEVASHLGQPLRASIKVQGASALKSADCFSVLNDASAENQINNANFKLSKVVDDVAILTVTTNQVMNEPIANLSIMAECDANMRRDYVVLLDPVLGVDIENTNQNEVETEVLAVVEKQNNVAQRVSKVASASNNVQTVKVAKTTKKRAASKKHNQDVVLTAGYDKTAAATTNSESVPAKKTPETVKQTGPRLSISAGEATDMPLQGAKLQLDRQLHFTPENAPLSLTKVLSNDIEIQDEVTVINNRMAHLNKQLDTLALQNKTLQANNQAVTQQLNQANSGDKLDWLGYILGGALLFASFNIANKWRRRRLNAQMGFADTELSENSAYANLSTKFDSNDAFFDFDKDLAFNKDTEDTTQHIDLFEEDMGLNHNELDAGQRAEQFSVEEFNDEQNILDHADVFLSHGRTSLAIQLLQNHLIEHPKKSVTEWLFLLDLLAKDNMQAMYEQTALECKEYFNIRVADFSNDEGSEKHHLEDFPRLIAGLEQVWGTPAAQVFLDDLIYNSRLETRVGFEKNVVEELLLLKNIAHESISTAQVIQLDDKKLALKAQKEAKLEASKEDRLKKVNELIEQKIAENRAQEAQDTQDESAASFEFNLLEYR